MSNIRRFHVKNSPVFITAVCFNRHPCFQNDENKALLLSIINEVKIAKPFLLYGYVLLNDHLHMLLMPSARTSFSEVMQAIKLRFTYRFKRSNKVSREIKKLWQNRFWDHIIRDEEDFRMHLDYIHFNPIKHGYIDNPIYYPWSSFSYYLNKGYYTEGWGKVFVPQYVKDKEFE